MWKHVLAFVAFVYYLFVCLRKFLHFYICNVSFILANNRILVFILELFLFLRILFNVCNNVFTFVSSFLTLIVNGIFESSHSRVLLKIVILFYIYMENSSGGVHFQYSCRYYVCRFGGGGLLRECFSAIRYLFIVWTAGFWGIALSGWLIILSTLFILTYMEGKLCGEHPSRVNFWQISGIVLVFY